MKKLNCIAPVLLVVASFIFMFVVHGMDSLWGIKNIVTVSSTIFIACLGVLFFAWAWNAFKNYDNFLKKSVKVIFMIVAFALSGFALFFTFIDMLSIENLTDNLFVFA